MLNSKNYQNIVSLFLSDEAEPGTGGDQPVRNNLTECNGKGERKFPNPNFLLQSLMPKKTLCFDRSKIEKNNNYQPEKRATYLGTRQAQQKTIE